MSQVILGCDPGTTETAICGFSGSAVTEILYASNEEILTWLKRKSIDADRPTLVIEKIVSYGMPLGETTLETVFYSGRFTEAYGAEKVERITRQEVKLHLCRSVRAKDGNVRMALINRFGEPGTKKKQGVLYGITSHKIQALAVAVTYWDKINNASI